MRHPGAVYGASKGRKPGSKAWYKPVFSGGKWNEFLRSRAVGSVLQVCCGGSTFGDVRIDRDGTVPGVTVVADMVALPLRTHSFDTVACDPMYDLTHPQRIRLQRELVRVARRRILFKAPWIPRGGGFAPRELVLWGSDTCTNVSVLAVLERDNSQLPLAP
jgi:hypothetical protein